MLNLVIMMAKFEERDGGSDEWNPTVINKLNMEKKNKSDFGGQWSEEEKRWSWWEKKKEVLQFFFNYENVIFNEQILVEVSK